MSDDTDDSADSEENLSARTPAVGSRPGSTSDPLPEYWGIKTLPPTIAAPDDKEPYVCDACERTLTADPVRDVMALWCPDCREFEVFRRTESDV